MTSLADLKRGLEALAGELYDHADQGDVWSTQSTIYHLTHARDHLAEAVHLLATHGPIQAIHEHILHGQTRAAFAAETWLRQQEPTP